MRTFYIFPLLILIMMSSCREEKEQPKVIYDNTKNKATAKKPDTTRIVISDLPIEITGTDYLIHPIGDVRLNPGSKSYNSSESGEISYTISNYNVFEITGFLRNLKFQKLDSDTLKVLTDKPVLIQTAAYLKPIADKTKLQLFVYTLADSDTNKDGQLDQNDIKSLYLSTSAGEKFTKLSPDLQELVDWKLLENKNRVYFRTIEDTNKNGEFDKNDVMHYSYVDLTAEWKAVSYSPI